MDNLMLKEIHQRQESDYRKYVYKEGVHKYIELIKAEVVALRKKKKKTARIPKTQRIHR